MSIQELHRLKALEARVIELERQVASMNAALALSDVGAPPPRKLGRPRKDEQQVSA